ncbi:NtaA/DmoA family FMN-dependent monooxygenase [Shimia sp. R10_1]|uniref:NtaA/DmoA family FMN-dependent monooxygenase n=1 Tax=Shimia sp. R10_1 TaxID=2821095 RepID=UPI001ADCA722|nr:NtaA/DmoA family FMN-dependent monooxygenase [Shimia sp. R10_1]MBO9475694.1 NtaA/DmoA family FMN-dependent monooxygenase [Shimia sp. R10_1]
MTSSHRLHIGFSANTTWLSGNAWRRPDSGVYPGGFGDPGLAHIKRAEAAHLDFIFRADVLYNMGLGSGELDPNLQFAAVAGQTSSIGLVTTASTMFIPPYYLARQLQSLHWLSNGRAGWNVVTSLGGHGNFGLDEMPSADVRYANARDYLEVIRKLWKSFPRNALIADRDSGQLIDPDLIQQIHHSGPFHKVEGPLNIPTHPAPLPLFQAGASPTGRDFAASCADAIFASCPDMEAALELRSDIRSRAVAHGRKADDIRVLPGLSLFLAETREAAQALFADTHKGIGDQRKIDYVRDTAGIDLTSIPANTRVTPDMIQRPQTVRSRTHADLLYRRIEHDSPTVEALLNSVEVTGSSHWPVIGTAQDAVDQIVAWHSAGAIDGFIAFPGGSMASYNLFFDEVMPRLVALDLFRSSYEGNTLASHLSRY